MKQLSFEELLNDEFELIHCPMTKTFHWIRITEGRTPEEFLDRIHFSLHGYDYLYESTEGMQEIKKAFSGSINVIRWDELNDI